MDPAESTRQQQPRSAEVEHLTRDLGKWATGEPNVRALGVVGSWARGSATAHSDVDLILLSDQPDRYTSSKSWLDFLEQPPVVREEQFGVVAERRVRLQSGLEIEFGIGPLSWARTTPVDAGTQQVVSGGLRILYDPDGLLAALQAAVPESEAEPIRIVPYDPSWSAQFEAEKALLDEALGKQASGGIHHVGSTAVPALAAKPVIDILVGVEDLASSKGCFEELAQLGYQYAPHRTDQMHWFCKPDPSHRTHHLHLVPTDSPRYRAELLFRDILRSRPDLAQDYANLKRGLARDFEHDRARYTEGKANFIEIVLRSGR